MYTVGPLFPKRVHSYECVVIIRIITNTLRLFLKISVVHFIMLTDNVTLGLYYENYRLSLITMYTPSTSFSVIISYEANILFSLLS